MATKYSVICYKPKKAAAKNTAAFAFPSITIKWYHNPPLTFINYYVIVCIGKDISLLSAECPICCMGIYHLMFMGV